MMTCVCLGKCVPLQNRTGNIVFVVAGGGIDKNNGGLDDVASNHNRQRIPFSRFYFMLNKREYEAGLSKCKTEFSNRENHTQDELDAIGRAIPICVMQDGNALAKYCLDKGLSFTDCFIIMTWVISQFEFLRGIRVSNNISYDDACGFYETARINTIVIHRLNWFAHEAIIEAKEVLQKDKRFKFSAKRDMNLAEKVWDVYRKEHRKSIDDTSWYALQDHLRLSNDAIRPYTEKVYETIRDYMIRLGMRDVELKARCQVALLMMRVVGNSFKAFFRDFLKESGVDFTRLFGIDDISAMADHFASSCNAAGVPTDKDEHGYYELRDFNPEKSQRFLWAWSDLMSALRDDDLMDEAAQKAININPEIQREYSQILAEEERKAMDSGIEQLGNKYKIGNL